MIQYIEFPPLESATDDGMLAMGGDLSLNTLVSAYAQGIFPWFNEEQPILWWSPDPRLVLYPDELKISRSLKKSIKRNNFTISCDTAFSKLVQCCALRGATAKRPFSATPETWITKDMANAYNVLFDAGYAHSVEVWQEGELVGGLYGLILGRVFFGESMFSNVSDASKVALVALCKTLSKLGFQVIDCQVSSDHLLSLGAREISRPNFSSYLEHIDLDQPFKELRNHFITADFLKEALIKS